MSAVKVAGILLGGGKSTRFGAPKLDALISGTRLLDLACGHFLDGGFCPVVFCGDGEPRDPRVLRAEAAPQMIGTLRSGLNAIPDMPFAFAPADMPALSAALIAKLLRSFVEGGHDYLVPCHAGRRGHPAFARGREPFFSLGDRDGAREVFRAAGDALFHLEVPTADVLFDIDTPEDLAAASSEEARRARLLVRGDLAS